MASEHAPPAESAGPPHLGHLLVTFDVDGTLVRARGTDANKYHKARANKMPQACMVCTCARCG